MDMNQGVLPEVATLLRRIVDDPEAAADQLEEMAARLMAAARTLRSQASKRDDSGGTRDPGGMTDRVQMRVVGPDGKTKNYIDTNESQP